MKCWIKNALGEEIVNHYVPASSANALLLAEAVLDGTYKVFEETSITGNDVGVTSATKMNVYLKNNESGKAWYIRGIFKSSLDTDEIKTALLTISIGGYRIDHVVFTDVTPLTFA